MQKLREEHYEDLNATKYNGTTETIEELDNLRQISRRQNVVPSIDPSGNNSSVQSYVPSVNT